MKNIQSFDDFPVNEGSMSEVDIIGRQAKTKDDFKREFKKWAKENAHNPAVAEDDDAIENFAKTYFNEDGTKKEEMEEETED